MYFSVGETLVWSHLDEALGKKVNDFIKIMREPAQNSKTSTGKKQYQVQILRTNEPALAFADELFRFEKVV